MFFKCLTILKHTILLLGTLEIPFSLVLILNEGFHILDFREQGQKMANAEITIFVPYFALGFYVYSQHKFDFVLSDSFLVHYSH